MVIFRLYRSNLHYNEKSTRKQATKSDGTLRWSISYPKAFKGEKTVAKPLKEKPTYGKKIQNHSTSALDRGHSSVKI